MKLGMDVYLKLITCIDLTTAIFNPKHTDASSTYIAYLMGREIVSTTC